MQKTGFAGNDEGDYFDVAFKAYGIPKSQGKTVIPYSGGVESFEYEYTQKNYIESVNKRFAEQCGLILKERGTNTDTYQVTTQYDATSGYAPVLIPIYVSQDIIDLSRKLTPLYAMLPKAAVQGMTIDWNKVTYNTDSARWETQDAAANEKDDTYARSSIPIKFCRAYGRVTGPAQVGSRGYIDMERQEVLVKTQALIQKIENEIINGNTSTDALGFDGLLASITTNSTTQSAAISLDALDNSLNHCRQGGESYSANLGGGLPNLIVTDLDTYKDLKQLLRPYLRYNGPMMKIAWGFETIDYEGIPVIASRFMTTTTTSKSLIILDTRVVKLGVSLDITMERLAKTNDSSKFMIKWYGALWVGSETFCAKIITIT